MGDWDVIHGSAREAEAGLTNRFAGGKDAKSDLFFITAENEQDLVVPQEGKQVTLYWISVYASERNPGEVLVEVTLAGKAIYAFYLTAPGAFMHWEPITGAPDQRLKISFVPAKEGEQHRIAVTSHYTESYPRSA